MSPTSNTTKRMEIKTIMYKDISVTYKIDYDSQMISIVERNIETEDAYGEYRPKQWVFANRQEEYMGSWKIILEAIAYAITTATKELNAFTKQQKAELNEKNIDLMKAVYGASIELTRRKKERKKRDVILSELFNGNGIVEEEYIPKPKRIRFKRGKKL